MEYYIGIDLGGTNIAAALVDEQGKILGRANLATGAGRPAAEIAADMAHAGRRAAEQAGVPIEQVSAVGMGVPGTANQKEGVLEFANNLGFLHEPIVEMMAGCFPGKKIWFDNDANAAAWGEYLAGFHDRRDSGYRRGRRDHPGREALERRELRRRGAGPHGDRPKRAGMQLRAQGML